MQNTWLFSVALSVGSVLGSNLSKWYIVHLTAPLNLEKKDFVSLLHSIILKYLLLFRLVGHFMVLLGSKYIFLNSLCFFSTFASLEYLNNCYYL